MGHGEKYYFGPFELFTGTRELSKSGTKVKLRGQPYLILEVLLSRAGKVVTREELRKQLWSADTFVDFEHGLNTSVKKLRQVLCDSADNPRYIETLPRVGYRFIAPVEVVAERAVASADAPIFSGEELGQAVLSAAGLNPQNPRARENPGTASDAPQQQQVTRSRPWLALSRVWLAGAGLLTILLGGYVRDLQLHRAYQSKRLTDKDTIVLADFANSTGDPVFDDALKQALSVELGQSPFLNVLSDRKISATLQMMGRSANEHVTVDIGHELCLRTGSKVVVGGTISSLGSHYLIDLNAFACGTDDTLAKEQVEATSKEYVLKALSRASSGLRTKLGESLPSVQKFDVPIEATTSSLEALRTYSMAMAVKHRGGDAPSIPFFKRAIELDPNFPMAYAGLAVVYDNLSQPSLALEYATQAYQLRDRVTEREQLRISAAYFRAVGEVDKEAQTYQLWIENYPRDPVPHHNLGANYFNVGQYDRALAEFQEGTRLAPDHVISYAAINYLTHMCVSCYTWFRDRAELYFGFWWRKHGIDQSLVVFTVCIGAVVTVTIPKIDISGLLFGVDRNSVQFFANFGEVKGGVGKYVSIDQPRPRIYMSSNFDGWSMCGGIHVKRLATENKSIALAKGTEYIRCFSPDSYRRFLGYVNVVLTPNKHVFSNAVWELIDPRALNYLEGWGSSIVDKIFFKDPIRPIWTSIHEAFRARSFCVYESSLDSYQGFSCDDIRILSGFGRPPHLVQLASRIIGVGPGDKYQQDRAHGFDTLRPICFLVIAVIAACGVVYSGCHAFDGGWRLLYILVSIGLLFVAFKFIHLGLQILDPW